jgi:hypothetical protein
LNVGVNGGVDDAALPDLGTREKDEFRLMEDAFGLDFGHVGHFADPIHRSDLGIKIIFHFYFDADAEGAHIQPASGDVEVLKLEFDADETAALPETHDAGSAGAHERVENEVAFAC